MNATPPEANTEYSRGHGASGRFWGLAEVLPAAVFGGGLLGALLLLVAEFTTLFTVQAATSTTPVSSVGTGDHHGYAMIPIALFAAALSYGAWRRGSRFSLAALGALGVIALLIALLADLPDAHATGLIKASKNLGTGVGSFVNATSRPSTGFYMETLGASLLMIMCAVGFLLGGAPESRPQARPAPPPRPV